MFRDTKKGMGIILLGVLILLAFAAAARAAEIKIGFVDMQRALNECDEGNNTHSQPLQRAPVLAPIGDQVQLKVRSSNWPGLRRLEVGTTPNNVPPAEGSPL